MGGRVLSMKILLYNDENELRCIVSLTRGGKVKFSNKRYEEYYLESGKLHTAEAYGNKTPLEIRELKKLPIYYPKDGKKFLEALQYMNGAVLVK